MSSRGPNQDQQVNAPMGATGMVIGNTMHSVLQAVQETSGPQYASILRAAGLTRFIDELPEEGWQPVASREELERLYSTVYQMLGESLTRLFMRNYGHRLAAQLLENPEIQEIIERVSALEPAQRLEAFIREFAPFSNRGWAALQISEDPQAWYLEQKHCPNCAGIHGASAPICQSPVVVYSTLAKAALGRPVQVSEVTCVAAGGSRCKFALTK